MCVAPARQSSTLDLYLNLNLHALHDKAWVTSIDNFMLQDIRALGTAAATPGA